MSMACRLHWKCVENGGLSACLQCGASVATACMGGADAHVVSKRGAFKMHIGAIEAPTANCWRWRCWGKCAHMWLLKFGVQLSFEYGGFEECSGDVVGEVSESECGSA